MVKRRFRYFNIISALTLILLSSCTKYKDIVYMNNIYTATADTNAQTITTKNNKNLVLQYDDNIYINIYGSTPSSLQMFNKSTVRGYNYSDMYLYMEGYVVDKEGFIYLPLIGKVNVLNKTLAETQKLIQTKIDEYIVGAVVEVRMLSFKITMLGEVRRPGTYKFIKRDINILEALGQAGDISDLGDKQNILVIRKNKQGETNTFQLDLTNSAFFNEQGFWLQPNDIVYVKPIKTKNLRINTTTTSLIFASLSTLFSAITTTLLIINFMK